MIYTVSQKQCPKFDWHMSSAEIQKSAAVTTFSNTSRERCVNSVFSADDKVLIESLYQSATEFVQTFD